MTSVPQYPPPPVAEPGAVSRLLAGILGVFSAALTVAGTFLPAAASSVTVNGRLQSSFSVSAWARDVETAPQSEQDLFGVSHVARFGIPITVAAVVLLIGAVLVFTRARAAARILLIAGSAGLVAAVWTTGMDVSASSASSSERPFVAPPTTPPARVLGDARRCRGDRRCWCWRSPRWRRPLDRAVDTAAVLLPAGERHEAADLPAHRTGTRAVLGRAARAGRAFTLPESEPGAEPTSPPFPPQDVQPAPGVEPPGKHRNDYDM